MSVNIPPIAEIATDPLQYDRPELNWDVEGGKDNHNRRLFREVLEPILHEVAGKQVLDIGCGQGWLCAEVANRGGVPTGIDPSEKSSQLAARLFPGVKIIRSSLEGYTPHGQFDISFLLMVEAYLDLPEDCTLAPARRSGNRYRQ